MSDSVTVCIPTYQSESFIERTLSCARNQTYRNLKILVSVDLSDDSTVQICEKHAQEDSRIEVIIQKKRLGWSQNTNVTLQRVETEFFFIYFHDDVIEPTYVETLLTVLQEQPDAASAHCDLVEFGLLETTRPAHSYNGSSLRRLIDFMMTQRGTTLRSLIRTRSLNHDLRFPEIHGDNHWTAYVFHMLLLEAGPAIGVDQPLYRRWQRENSLTRSKGWAPTDLESLLCGQKESADMLLSILYRVASSNEEWIMARYCLSLFMMIFTRTQQLLLNSHEDISGLALPPLLDPEYLSFQNGILDKEAEKLVKSAEKKLKTLEKRIRRMRRKNILSYLTLSHKKT